MIRKLSPDDSAALFELIDIIEADLPDKSFWLPIDKLSRDNFLNDEWTEFYGAFDGGILAGASALFYNEHEYGGSKRILGLDRSNVAEIGRAMVRPEYRGRNLLFKINSVLLDVAEKKGIEYVLSTVHPGNIPSRSSLQKLGMNKAASCVKNEIYPRDIFLIELKKEEK